MELRVNDRTHAVPPEWRAESLLSVLREQFGLVGAKFGCGVGLCGACTVLVDGQAHRSCLLQIDEALEGHLCRCGTQPRIRRAVHRAAGLLK